jgi:hypothetical protein
MVRLDMQDHYPYVLPRMDRDAPFGVSLQLLRTISQFQVE